MEVEDGVFRRFPQTIGISLLRIADLADGLLNRAQSVVELAWQRGRVHAFLQAENQFKCLPRLVHIRMKDPGFVVNGLD